MEINLEERLHSEQLWLVWTDGAWGGLMDVMVVMDEQRGGSVFCGTSYNGLDPRDEAKKSPPQSNRPPVREKQKHRIRFSRYFAFLEQLEFSLYI